MLQQWQRMAGFAALGFVATTPLGAEMRTDIGILTCALAESAGSTVPIEGATTPPARDMLCWFRPFRNGPEETYVGTILGVGQERKLFKTGVMIWIVRGAPATQASSGLLQQTYAADASAAPGYGPPLVGETRTGLVLQPMTEKEPPVLGDKVQPLDAIIVAVELVLRSSPG